MEQYLPDNTCRTCLQQSDELTSLYTEDDDTGLTLLEKLRFCVSMQVLVSERTPTNACAPCVRSIVDFCDFKRRCELSEKTLEGLCGEPPEYAVPKIEVVYMEEGSTPVAKMEPEEPDLSCDDGSDWTPGLDDEEKVDDRGNGSGIKDGNTESNLKFACETCGKRFRWNYSLKRHRQIHSSNYKGEEERAAELQSSCNDDDQNMTPNEPIEDKFPCDECSSSYATIDYLKNHKYRCHSVKRHRCDLCGISFVHPYRVRQHMRTHMQRSHNGPDVRFKCDTCRRSFKSKQDLQKHVRKHLAQKTKCDGCSRLFVSLPEMLEHRSGAHPHLDPYVVKVSREDQLTCHVCKKMFSFRSGLRRHLRLHSAGELLEAKSQVQENTKDCHEPELPRDNDASGPANVPEQEESENADLEQHEFEGEEHGSGVEDDRSESNLKFACQTCGKRFQSKTNLRRHRIVHVGLHSCPVCCKSFKTEEERSSHAQTCCAEVKTDKKLTPDQPDDPNNEYKHKCHVCSRSYATVEYLRNHVRRCHSTRQHRCDQCGVSFAHPYRVRQHMRMHMQNPPKGPDVRFKCDTCGRSFRTKQDLRKHALKHLLQRTACDGCNGLFKSLPEMLEHRSSAHPHLDPYVAKVSVENQLTCHVCKKMFSFRSCLRRHLQLHTADEPLETSSQMQKQAQDGNELELPRDYHDGFSLPTDLLKHREGANVELPRHDNSTGSPTDSTANVLEHRESENQDLEQHKSKDKILTASQLDALKEGRHPCDQCSSSFGDVYYLKKHKYRCHSVKRHRCDQCGISFVHPYRLRKHMRTHRQRSNNASDVLFNCDVCNESFKTKEDLQEHVVTHLKQETKCDDCNELFDSVSEMLEHKASAHPHVDPLAVEAEHQFKCGTCGESFETESQMQEHARDHHEQELPYDGDDSGSQIDSKEDVLEQQESANQVLEQHETDDKILPSDQLDVLERKFPCDECSSSFKNVMYLKQHKKRCHMEKQHRCDLCGDSFSEPWNLRRHMKTHTHRKAHCDSCNKLFDSLPEMLQHRASAHPHLDPYVVKAKRDFKCGGCGKLFETESFMQEHYARAHQKRESLRERQESANPDLEHESKGEERGSGVEGGQTESKLRFACETCGKRFRVKGSLNKHRMKHIGAYACPVCCERFETKEERSMHVQKFCEGVKTAKRQFKCGTCGESFETESQMQEHARDHHEQELPHDDDSSGSLIDSKVDVLEQQESANQGLEQHETDDKMLTSNRLGDLERKFPCDECPRSFKTIMYLKQHKKRCHMEKQHRCDLCEDSFVAPYLLRKHMTQAHHKAFCDSCNKLFDSLPEMLQHRTSVHPDLGPYVVAEEKKKEMVLCDECPGSFTNIYNLKQHKQRCHMENGKQRHCDLCGDSFVHPYELRRHMKTHTHRKAHCDSCNKLFDSLPEMLEHRTSAHPHLDPYVVKAKRDFKCGNCGKLFETESRMQEHYARVHQKQQLPRDVKNSGSQNDSTADVADHRESANSDSEQHETKEDEDGSDVKDGRTETKLKFACETCGKRFRWKGNLKRHRMLHLGLYSCPGCSERFKTKEQQTLHVQTCSAEVETGEKHGSGVEDGQTESKLEFACETCGKRFNRKSNLKKHCLLHIGKYACPVCCERFKTKEEQTKHMQTCCGDVEADEKLAPKPSDDLAEGDKRPCDECSGSFINLKLHKMRRHSQRHCCELCGSTFTQAYRLRRHIRHTHRKTANYVCETCGKAYTYEQTLRHHIEENHAAEKPVHTCNLCGKTYNFLASLHAHKRIHKPDLRLKCDRCERTYPSTVRLAQHVRITHEKPHPCDECDKRFLTKQKLVKHKTIHARHASKPYACKVCDKRFSTTSAVSFHMDTQHRCKKHLKCDVCGMEFYNRFHYAAHYSGHTGVKPCRCDGCGKGYNYNRNLVQHQKTCAALLKLTQQ